MAESESIQETVKQVFRKIIKFFAVFYLPSILAAFIAILIFGRHFELAHILTYTFIGPLLPILILPLLLPLILVPFLVVLWITLFIYAIVVKGNINGKRKLCKAGRYRLISFIWAIATFLILLFLMRGPLFIT